MNILYIVHQFYPEFHTGTEKFLLNLSSAIQRDAHFAQVITYSFSEHRADFQRNQNILSRNYSYRGLPVTSVRHRTMPLDLNIYFKNKDIYQFATDFLKNNKPYDLMHIAHSMRLAPFAQAALDFKIPYILTLTDFWTICPRITLQTSTDGTLCTGPERGEACARYCPEMQSTYIKDRLAAANRMLSGAKALISPSKFLAAIFEKELPALKVHIIPHGMDLKYIKTNSRKYRPGNKITFSYCGGFSPHKGVHLLLKAFRSLNAKNAELKLYGSSFYEHSYFQLLKDIAGGDARVHFCGSYTEDHVGDVMSNSDALILPSLWYENYPLVLHEALACNVPVIASNIGGMAEKIKNSINGFTFQVGDEEELAARLKMITDNPEILNGIKEKIKGYVPPRVEEEAYMYQRLYNTIAKDNPGERP
jgi:glycosyltransferase involved in cell wall biosynthesis